MGAVKTADAEFLPYDELKRWTSILLEARRAYLADGNAAKAWFESDQVEDLIFSMGLRLPQNYRDGL